MKSAYWHGLLPLAALLAGALAAGPSARVEDEGLSGAAVYRRTVWATAWVRAAGEGKGSGWLLDPSRRWLVTCYHVVGDNDTVDVVFPVRRGGALVAERAHYVEDLPLLTKDGHAVRGRVLRRDKDRDLALVELEALPPGVAGLRLSARSPAPGERVHVVGNRYDTDALWLYTGGAVRQVQTLREGYFHGGRQLARGARVVVAQAPVNEGDSGGPLVNARGEVVGVVAAVAWEVHGAGLFIDVSEVRKLLGRDQPPPGPGRAAPRPTPGPLAPRDVYRRGLRSLALVQASPGRRDSGWLLDRAHRLLLTTAEAVGKEETVDVVFPMYQDGRPVAEAAFYREQRRLLEKKGALVRGCVLATDARRNLALLELEAVPEGVVEARLSAGGPAPGDALHAFSNPTRLEVLWAYAAASVRQLGHANLGQTAEGPDPAVVIVQAPFGGGEGGGPLLDERGEVAGVVSGKTGPQQQVGYALAAREVAAFVAENRPRWAPAGAAELCRRGALFLQARRYERARLDFDAAIRLDPRYAPAFSGRGRAYHLMGDDDRALADCTRAVRLDPRLAEAYCHRAGALCGKGEPGRAVADCDTALRLEPGCALAYSTRARARLLGGDADGALRDGDEAIWLDRKLAAAHLYRGQAHARKDEHRQAVDDCTHALRLDPRLAEAYRARAESRWAQSDVAAALADYDQALALDPRDARAYHGRGRGRSARGESVPALADFTAAVRLDPRLAGAYLDRGSEHVRRGDLDRGVADYAQALRLQRRPAADVVAEVERRGAELGKGGAEGVTACCELYRKALTAFRPLFGDCAEAQKAIDAGLAAAGREADPSRRAKLLGAVLASVGGKR
jgi:tetratricopeptide (TPR) repeat protein